MGRLTLIRHGQAKPFEKNSDLLSTVGEEQARALARYWIRTGQTFDEVYAGTLVRQRRTAQIVAEIFAEESDQSLLRWPELHSIPGLNEYDADGLINRLVPALAARDQKFNQLLTSFEQHKTSPERNRYFQKMFEAVTAVWLSGELQVDEVELWHAFRSRVLGAIKQIVSVEGSGRRVAVFTSGGVIGLCVQNTLDAPNRQALEINWRVRNCSLTEFVFNRDRLSLDLFNGTPHLDHPTLMTFR